MTGKVNIDQSPALAMKELATAISKDSVDKSSGLHTDFSEKAVQARIKNQISGQPRKLSKE